MNKNYIFLFITIIAIVVGILIFIYNSNNSQNKEFSNYNSSRTSQNIDNTDISENQSNSENTNSNENKSDSSSEKQIKETEISSFTTKIYTKDSDRQNNITIACSTLNDTIVENGNTFSFSNVVGKATTGKGYKKADVFKNGNVIEALGGGLCQISTTLYNAVLKIPNAKVTERHSHSNKVPYIKSGKDAAVSYGTYDFKFVNNTGNSLKIKAENTPNNMTIKILKIE